MSSRDSSTNSKILMAGKMIENHLEDTRILIAHRPETIASAERVIVLQGGKVTQDLRRVPGAGERTM